MVIAHSPDAKNKPTLTQPVPGGTSQFALFTLIISHCSR